ncbi:clotting factor B [Caerostris extrusa]|uniref:Clotting factor B n=1 Tax=Caerostris extrusa TaxID=172846 RepID=A0AAV4TPX9_CAEEX|nr:clotting factor B [Caerostris extrusa]
MGGEEAQTGAWPWMVVISRLERTGDLSPWCTGFLISRRHVLSAAHCFDRRNASLYAAMVGSVESSQGEVYRVSRIAVPEGYTRGQFYDDIALLTLTRDVEGDNFRAICLPRSREFRNMTGTGTTVAGWGATRVGGDMSPRLRQLSYMPVISYPRCNQMFSERLSNFQRQFPRGITSQFVCAGFIDESGKDSCGGDSGAPLMLQENDQWYAIGIVSFGFACGRQGYPGGYTRMSHYLNWIERNTQS